MVDTCRSMPFPTPSASSVSPSLRLSRTLRMWELSEKEKVKEVAVELVMTVMTGWMLTAVAMTQLL